MKASIKQLHEFNAAAAQLKIDCPAAKKLIAAVERFGESIEPHFVKFNRTLADVRLKHANTDANGSLLYEADKQTFAYTKEGYAMLRDEVDELSQEKKYEVDPIIIETTGEIPKQLIPFLEGFVLKTKDK